MDDKAVLQSLSLPTELDSFQWIWIRLMLDVNH